MSFIYIIYNIEVIILCYVYILIMIDGCYDELKVPDSPEYRHTQWIFSIHNYAYCLAITVLVTNKYY